VAAGAEFLQAEAAEARGGVERGEDKGRDGELSEGAAVCGRQTERSEKGTDAVREDIDGIGSQPGIVTLRECSGGDKRDDGEDAFDEHGAVADGAGVAFIGELFGRGTGGDEGVEAGDGAAGDNDKEHGKERAKAGLTPRGEDGQVQGGAGGADAQDTSDHQGIEEERRQIVARLQERPDRRNGRGTNVESENEEPESVWGERGAKEAEAAGRERERETQAKPDAEGKEREEGGGDAARAEAQAVDEETECESKHEIQCGGHGSGGAFDKRLGGELSEDGDDKGEGSPAEDEEEEAAERAEGELNDFAHAAAMVAGGGEEGQEVVCTADKDGANDDPEGDWTPAVGGSEDGADDRAGAGDGGEVMAEEDRGGGGDVVNTVTEGVGGGGTRRINGGEALQAGAVAAIGEGEGGKGEQENQDAGHREKGIRDIKDTRDIEISSARRGGGRRDVERGHERRRRA